MPDRLVAALRESVQEIAETMLFVEISPGASTRDHCRIAADSSAVIGYSGALTGGMRLGGSSSSVLKLASTLLGEERDTLDNDMEDAFMELANMIAGGVQTRIEGDMGTISITPPVMVSGSGQKVINEENLDCVHQEFDLDGEAFFTELYYIGSALNPKSGS